MALQSSGAISLSDIQGEFGGSSPISLSEYYRNGGYTTDNNTSVPTSGTISVGSFYNGVRRIYLQSGTVYVSNGAITAAGSAIGLGWTLNNAGYWGYQQTGVVATLTLPPLVFGNMNVNSLIIHYDSAGNPAIQSGEDKAGNITINSASYGGSYYEGWGATPNYVTYNKTVNGLNGGDVLRIWNYGGLDWRNFNALGEYWHNITLTGA